MKTDLKFRTVKIISPVPDKYKHDITARVGDTGPRWATIHKGTDFAVPEGTNIYCVSPGIVVHASNDEGPEGLYLSVDSKTRYGTLRFLYFHLSKVFVNVGQFVDSWFVLGLSGNTGNSSGPHLHFQIQKGQGKMREFFVPEFK